MLPTEDHSENIGPPWKPEVWMKSPEELVSKAQLALFEDRAHIENGVLTANDLAMSGTKTAPQNESDQLINSISTSSSRAANWQNVLGELRNTEPIVWSNKPVRGGINPPP